MSRHFTGYQDEDGQPESVEGSPGPDPDNIWTKVVCGDGEWAAWGRYVRYDDTFALAEVRIIPNDMVAERSDAPGEWAGSLGLGASAPTPGGLTTRVLRTVRTGDLWEDFVRKITPYVEGDPTTNESAIGELGSYREQDRATTRRAHHRPRSKTLAIHYAERAKEFAELHAQGLNWTDVMGTMSKRHTVAPSTPENWHRRARELGYLAKDPTTRRWTLTDEGRRQAFRSGQRRTIPQTLGRTPPLSDDDL